MSKTAAYDGKYLYGRSLWKQTSRFSYILRFVFPGSNAVCVIGKGVILINE